MFAIVWPGVTLWTLIIVFGAYALVDGMGSRDDAGTVHWAKKPVVAHPDDVYEWQNTLSVPVILLLNHLPAAQRYQAPASMPAEGA